MTRLSVADRFQKVLCSAKDLGQIAGALEEFSEAVGFQHFALTHHLDFATAPGDGIRLHNYPVQWQEWFDERSLGRQDPIHRASHVAAFGFTWSTVPRLISLTRGDHEILQRACRIGIGDGFTVPAHVPGEVNGSCSFAVGSGDRLPEEHLLLAQLVGGLAFEAARKISRPRRSSYRTPVLTDRQRDCILWAARGKTDWEIACILGISHETVIQHLKHARERYGVRKRAHLAVMALFDGSICFSDVFIRSR